MTNINDYPQQVIDRTNEFIDSLNSCRAFELIDTTEDLVKECLAEKILKHWISEGDLEISEDAFNKAIIKAEVNYTINKLKEKELVVEIDDDTITITEKGKKFLNK
jgi:predicted transcriptional regulator